MMRSVSIETGLFMVAAATIVVSASAATVQAAGEGGVEGLQTVRLDFAYYNPLSLVVRHQRLLEQDLEKEGVKVEWVQSLGSNKALELLRGDALDFGSTAGAASLIGRANGNRIKAIYVYGYPEWTALVTAPGSGIKKIADLKGKKIAVTRGTDPHVFLLRALASVRLTEEDVELVPLQHSDGKVALLNGSVAAWAGLDPYMAQVEVEKGYLLFFRKKEWNTAGFLNVREAFAKIHPQVVAHVVGAYERARQWTLENPDAAREILRAEAKLSDEVARKVWTRHDFSDSSIGARNQTAIIAAGDVLKSSHVIDRGVDVAQVATELIDPRFSARLRANK
jgi:sulfonate transport system substrate-binding protein